MSRRRRVQRMAKAPSKITMAIEFEPGALACPEPLPIGRTNGSTIGRGMAGPPSPPPSPPPTPTTSGRKRPGPAAAAVQKLWNEIAAPRGLRPVDSMTQQRREKIATRSAHPRLADLDGWRSYVTKIATSQFCCGGGDRKWKAN